MFEFDDNLIRTLTDEQIKAEMQSKEYLLSTFDQYEKDLTHMKSSNQTGACLYNMNNIKYTVGEGKYYIVRLSDGRRDIRYWEVV